MTTVPQTRTDLLAARKAVAGLLHCTGYAGAVADAGVAAAGGTMPAAFSGNIAPISWHAPRSRNIVASVVTPAA